MEADNAQMKNDSVLHMCKTYIVDLQQIPVSDPDGKPPTYYLAHFTKKDMKVKRIGPGGGQNFTM